MNVVTVIFFSSLIAVFPPEEHQMFVSSFEGDTVRKAFIRKVSISVICMPS